MHSTQLLAHGRWFSPGTPASSTTKTGRHDIAEILLKVALKHQKSISQSNMLSRALLEWLYWSCSNRPLKSFEDTKVVIRSRNSKDRQKQWPTEKYKQRCIKHYTENKDRATRTKNSSSGADPRGGAHPKIGKNMIFWRKIVIFHTKYPNNFFKCALPPNLNSWIRPWSCYHFAGYIFFFCSFGGDICETNTDS